MKRMLAFLLVALMALAALPAVAEQQDVTLSFVRIGSDEPERAYWQWVIGQFEAANPGVKIAYDEAAIGEAMETKLNTLFASGAGPDLIGHGILSVAQRVELGQYQPIDSYFQAWSGKDDILPSILANGTYKGHVYGLGYSATPFVFAYRKDLFEAAGLDPNAPPTTWEQLADYARKLTVKTGDEITQAGFCFPQTGGNLVEFDVFVFGNGGRFMDADSNPTLTGDEKVKALEFLKGLLPDVNIPYSNSETNPFVKGQAAMTLINNVALTKMLADPAYADKVGVALPPNNGTPATFSGCNMLFIGSGCQNTDQAFAFIDYTLSPDATLKRAQDLRIPVTRASLTEQYKAMDPYNAVRLDCVANGIGMPRATWATSFQKIRNELVQSVLFGDADPAEALQKAQADLLGEIG